MAETTAIMKGKTVVVTGASSGIGLEASLGLAKLGARVVMVARDKKRGLAAVDYVKTNSNNGSVELLLCDMSSMKNVQNPLKTTGLSGLRRPLYPVMTTTV